MTDDLLSRIEINPEVMLGKPVIRGTRITVEIVLEKIAAGSSVEEILDDYPRLFRGGRPGCRRLCTAGPLDG